VFGLDCYTVSNTLRYIDVTSGYGESSWTPAKVMSMRTYLYGHQGVYYASDDKMGTFYSSATLYSSFLGYRITWEKKKGGAILLHNF